MEVWTKVKVGKVGPSSSFIIIGWIGKQSHTMVHDGEQQGRKEKSGPARSQHPFSCSKLCTHDTVEVGSWVQLVKGLKGACWGGSAVFLGCLFVNITEEQAGRLNNIESRRHCHHSRSNDTSSLVPNRHMALTEESSQKLPTPSYMRCIVAKILPVFFFFL